MAKPQREVLTRERILRAALRVVDEEGLEAISMRRLGEEVGVEAMSLYNHVEGKAAVLDGLFEVVLEELPEPRRSTSWRVVLREQARALRALLKAHPHALPLFATRPAVTPASIVHVERVLEILGRAGFRPGDALSALQVLVAFVVGHSVSSYAQVNPAEASAPKYAALDEERFPRVRAMARLLATHDVEKEFEFGLEAMLRGLADRGGRPES